MAVIWEGEPLKEFKPLRDLRQGDPLSPYLFVHCLEILSNMTIFKVEEESWKGVEITRGRPSLIHLLFADDLMLFG